jgi:hypothetical protein
MESFNVRTTLTSADWHALMLSLGARVSSSREAKSTLVTRFGPTAIWVAGVCGFVFMLNTKPPLMRPLGMAIALVLFFGTWWVQYLIQRRSHLPDERGAFLGDAEFEFEAGGFRSRRAHSESFNRWEFVREVTNTDEHVFLWIDAFSAYVVPARDLPSTLTAPAAASRLREFISATVREPATESAIATPASVSRVSLPQALPVASRPSVLQEISALLRLHTWGVVDGARLFGRDATILLLGVFSFVLWAALDRLNYEGTVEVFWFAISETGVLVLAVLLAAWVLARVCRPRVELRRSLLVVLGFLPVFVTVIWFAARLPKIGAIVVAIAMTAWADRYLVAGMRSLTGTRQQLAATSVLAVTLLLFYLSTTFYFSPGVWYEPEPDAERTASRRQENEQLVFEQSARLDAAIGKLAPRDPTMANTFFVGFAGYGGQRVFAEEIALAAQRIGERYGATDRSLRLVNDRRDQDAYPVANIPALRHTLRAIARRMNLEEDVLFLSLSSHGSENATISVSSELGYWRDLSAAELADMLREAGIRWKVVVISACHSGSFIEALRDEQSIILTAAAADRASFGCSDENDLTYFGEAFYRDALPAASTLRAAFETARETIRARERGEARIASNPQAHFGAALESKLAAMDGARTNTTTNAED